MKRGNSPKTLQLNRKEMDQAAEEEPPTNAEARELIASSPALDVLATISQTRQTRRFPPSPNRAISSASSKPSRDTSLAARISGTAGLLLIYDAESPIPTHWICCSTWYAILPSAKSTLGATPWNVAWLYDPTFKNDDLEQAVSSLASSHVIRRLRLAPLTLDEVSDMFALGGRGSQAGR